MSVVHLDAGRPLEPQLAPLLALLERGSRDPRHPFRRPTLATSDERGAPDARVVVLRDVEVPERRLTIYTDGRSPKVAQLRRRPRGCCVFWSERERLQLRVYGPVTLHRGDPVALERARALSPRQRQDYESPLPPGAPLDDGAAPPAASADHELTVLRLTIERIDALQIAERGPTRAEFRFAGTASTARWLTP